MNRLLIIAGLVILAVTLMFLNQGVKKSAVAEHEENEQAQTQKPAPTTTPASVNAVLLPEETLGDPATVKYHILVGWVYNEVNQQKPETLTVPIQAIRDYVSHINEERKVCSAEIVNLDVPTEDRSPAAQAVTNLGISVDGQILYPNNVSETPASPQMIMQALGKAMGRN